MTVRRFLLAGLRLAAVFMVGRRGQTEELLQAAVSQFRGSPCALKRRLTVLKLQAFERVGCAAQGLVIRN